MSPRSTLTPARLAGLALFAAASVAPAQVPIRAAWTALTPANAPSARTAHGLVYHEGIQRTVLFGGCDDASQCLDDLWLWDGTDWTAAGSGGPAPRYGHAMVYDSGRDRIVLFGGGDTSNRLFGDTWEWDGNGWQQVATTGPAPRWNLGMAYDPVRRRVVLFGGNNLQTSYGDTWEWDGASWTRRFSKENPYARMATAMAWDGNTRKVILRGGFGFGASNLISGYSWFWDGMQWARAPGGIEGSVASYADTSVWDAARKRVVMFGGITLFTGAPRYSWGVIEFDRTGWFFALPWPTLRPPARAWTPIAYDTERAVVVMFGGNDETTTFGDTWEYAATDPATYDAFGSGCPGSAGTPTLEIGGNLPWADERIEFRLKNLPAGAATFLVFGVSRTQWGPLALPFALGPLAPGCSALASHDTVLPLSNQNGKAGWSTLVPRVVGATFYLQGIIADPVNPLGLTFTHGGEATIGAK